jgi:hypothetical protein
MRFARWAPIQILAKLKYYYTSIKFIKCQYCYWDRGLGACAITTVPSHYCLFIDSPLFTLSTILQYYDIFPFLKKFTIFRPNLEI